MTWKNEGPTDVNGNLAFDICLLAILQEVNCFLAYPTIIILILKFWILGFMTNALCMLNNIPI